MCVCAIRCTVVCPSEVVGTPVSKIYRKQLAPEERVHVYLPVTLDFPTQPITIPRPQPLTNTCNLLNGSCFTDMGSEALIRTVFIYIQVCYERCRYNWAQLDSLGPYMMINWRGAVPDL